MWSKLQEVEQRYEELTSSLSSPEVAADANLLRKYSKEHKDLTAIVETFRRFKKVRQDLEESKTLLEAADDAEMIEMVRAEIQSLEAEQVELEARLLVLLIPKDPNDDKNIILEIRAGAGGDEAGIFVGDLYRMYTRYAEDSGFRLEPMTASYAPAGGYKEIIAMINGEGAYSRFKYESGVHRVQRVPATEAQGRIHTSTVTVAVLPEAEDVEVEINEKDLRIDVFRASGPGGQSVNTTDSAVRVTHIPSGIVVSMQDEKSQHKNKDKALKVLRSKLYELKQAEVDAERRDDRRSQVGSGDRSEKIRTYNYPQSRVTDHRIGLTLHSLDAIMNGDINQVVEPLIAHYQAESLKNQSQ